MRRRQYIEGLGLGAAFAFAFACATIPDFKVTPSSLDASTSDAKVVDPDSGDQGDVSASGEPLMLFVTSSPFAPTFLSGGVDRDTPCAEAALNANLGGTWKTFIWRTDSSPMSTLRAIDSSSGPVTFHQVLFGGRAGQPVLQLENGVLTRTTAPILTESGASAPDAGPWTGGILDGGGSESQGTCANWTATSQGGIFGSAIDQGRWLHAGTESPCTTQHPLFCIQVAR